MARGLHLIYADTLASIFTRMKSDFTKAEQKARDADARLAKEQLRRALLARKT